HPELGRTTDRHRTGRCCRRAGCAPRRARPTPDALATAAGVVIARLDLTGTLEDQASALCWRSQPPPARDRHASVLVAERRLVGVRGDPTALRLLAPVERRCLLPGGSGGDLRGAA